jgi:hypothetical protein
MKMIFYIEIRRFMDLLHTLSIIATVIACAYYIHRDIINDMKSQTARTDRLYEMFCDLRKESDQKLSDYRKESDQKFYDLLKEIKK